MGIGTKHWAITEGWILPPGDGAVAFLNGSLQAAHLQVFVSYSKSHPVGRYRLTGPAGRLRSVSFRGLKDVEPIQRATDYVSTIESDVPIVVPPGFASLQPRSSATRK